MKGIFQVVRYNARNNHYTADKLAWKIDQNIETCTIETIHKYLI